MNAGGLPTQRPSPGPVPARSPGGPEPSPSPRERYARDIEQGRLCPDPAQARVVGAFQELYEHLRDLPAPGQRVGGLFGRLGARRPRPVRGIYLWGGVGQGKSLIMNAFFDSLSIPSKLRVHFHAFMQYVHDELDALGPHRDPLARVADGLSADTRIVCFDEFQVHDITDAMLLGRLLKGLFERGVTLVATSNVEPDLLYRDGLQRSRFLPAIEAIKTHTRVLHLDGETDYRLRALERADTYHWPLDKDAERALYACFEGLNPCEATEGTEGTVLDIAGREVPARRTAEGIAWFEFEALCATARSSIDYIEIARRFHTVLVANVPVMDDERHDAALRFVHLVDELYERHVNLVVSAAAPPAALYVGARHEARFARTRSRLVEMQSRNYLSRPHLA